MRKITYHKEGDYYIPDLYLAEDEYTKMFLNGSLRKQIVDTDKQSKESFEILMKKMLNKNPIDENLKDTDLLKLVSL